MRAAESFRKICLGIAGVAVVTLIAGIATKSPAVWRPAAVAMTASLAIGLGAFPITKSYQFTAWIAAAVTAGLVYPAAFLKWGSFDLRNKWVILLVVQTVMFGMGTQMGLRDFAGLAKAPRG